MVLVEGNKDFLALSVSMLNGYDLWVPALTFYVFSLVVKGSRCTEAQECLEPRPSLLDGRYTFEKSV